MSLPDLRVRDERLFEADRLIKFVCASRFNFSRFKRRLNKRKPLTLQLEFIDPILALPR